MNNALHIVRKKANKNYEKVRRPRRTNVGNNVDLCSYTAVRSLDWYRRREMEFLFGAGVSHTFVFVVTFTFRPNSYLPGNNTRRFYPRRSSGQAVVTDRYRPFFPPGTCLYYLSSTGFDIPAARQFSSNVANSPSRDFRYLLFNFIQEKVPTNMHLLRLEPPRS